MSKLQVYFGDPEHGWINFSAFNGEEKIVQCLVSDIYPSFDELVTALSTMFDGSGETLATWTEEPGEFELRFSRRSSEDEVWLDFTSFRCYPDREPREKREPDFSVNGSYTEICLPFHSALLDLESRCFVEKSDDDWRWTSEFPTRELALLTERLGKI